jgi:hypothetical protein
MKLFEKIGNKYIATSLIVLSLLIWVDIFVFFREDDWTFIIDYTQGKTFADYFLIGHGGHVIPLFQFFYSIELSIFGKNALLFQIVSVFTWGLLCFVYYIFLINIGLRKKSDRLTAFCLVILFCLHPNFSDIIYWIFQQGVILHLLFQLLTVFFYFEYIKENSKKLFSLFLSCMIIQNYLFGNGLLFPMVFVAHFMIHKKKWISIEVIFLSLLQLGFILIQKALSLQPISLELIFNNSYLIILGYCKLIAVSISRLFFIKNYGGWYTISFALMLFSYLSVLAYRNNRSYFIFSILCLLVLSVAIPLARFQVFSESHFNIRYYYSTLLFLPISTIIFLALSYEKNPFKNKLRYIFVFYLVSFYSVGLQTKKIFSYKNFKNKEALQNAVIYGKLNYYPFEDAIFSSSKNIYLDHLTAEQVLYSTQKTSYFLADSTIIEALGYKKYKIFLEKNKQVVDSYIKLSKESLFDLDIGYEKK